MSREEFTSDLADSLYGQRERLRLTQAEVARGIGVSHVTVGNWERGLCVISAYHQQRLLAFFERMRLKREAAASQARALEPQACARKVGAR